jgi:hypothetical protein
LLLPAIRCGQAVDCPSTRLLRRRAHRVAPVPAALDLPLAPGAPSSSPNRALRVHIRSFPTGDTIHLGTVHSAVFTPHCDRHPGPSQPTTILLYYTSVRAQLPFFSKSMSNPSTGGIQAQWPSPPGLAPSPGCCPRPHLLDGDLTGAAWFHSPWFNPSGPASPLDGIKCSRCSSPADPRGKRTSKSSVEESAPKNHRSEQAPNRVTHSPPLWERRFAPSMLFLK